LQLAEDSGRDRNEALEIRLAQSRKALSANGDVSGPIAESRIRSVFFFAVFAALREILLCASVSLTPPPDGPKSDFARRRHPLR
jgi:hypothetical protein